MACKLEKNAFYKKKMTILMFIVSYPISVYIVNINVKKV